MNLRYRKLGRTDLLVSELALGTVELGMDYGIPAPDHYGRPAEADAIRLVHGAVAAGINFIDTARAYGESERVVGKALRGRRAEMILATKVDPYLPDGELPTGDALRRTMLDSLESSLRHLQSDYVDVWKLHSVDAALLAEHEVIADAFAAAQQQGKVRFTGASFYGSALAEESLAFDLFDVIQVTYSVFDQRLADRVLPLAQEQNIGVVGRSALLKGALTDRAEFLPPQLEPLRARSRDFLRLVAVSGLDLSPAQAALAFALSHPGISTVLVGVRSELELQEDLGALTHELPAAFRAELAALRLDDPQLLDPSSWPLP